MKLGRRAAGQQPREAEKTDAEWREALTRQQYDVLRRAALSFQADKPHAA